MLILRADSLDAPGIAHGFFGRSGGVSHGIYESLNCGLGSADDITHVIENRRRVQSSLGADTLCTLYQVHSAKTVMVDTPWITGPEADAMATRTKGIALGILSADCAPVLLADSEAGVIGAAHAGWKGALGGIVESAISAMEQLGASRARIAAAIGPCISQANYEVTDAFRERFVQAAATNERFFAAGTRPGHRQFDLDGFVADRLQRAGVDNVSRLFRCTYAHEGEFFSFRRATHRRETDYGREISAIVLL